MKISKVDHLHSGIHKEKVSVRTDTGYLYRPVGRDTGKMIGNNLSNHIKERRDKAQALYSVFNPFDDKFCEYYKDTFSAEIEKNDKLIKRLKYAGEEIRTEYTRLLTHSLMKMKRGKKGKNKNGDSIEDFENSFEWLKGKSIDTQKLDGFNSLNDIEKEQLITIMVSFYLRKKLSVAVCISGDKTVSFKEITGSILQAALLADNNKRSDAYARINKEGALRYLRALHKDYYKDNQVISIERSIKNQNIPVQCRNVNGKMHLMLSNGEFDGITKGSISKKSFIFSFLKEYGGMDDKSQKEKLLSELNRLLVLFIYGREVFSACENNTFTDYPAIISNCITENQKYFCGEINAGIFDSTSETKESEKRNNDVIVKGMMRNAFREHYTECLAVLSDKYGVDPNKKDFWNPEMKRDMYWVTWFEECIERILRLSKANSRLRTYKLENDYLYRKCWKEFMSFVAQKYISIGKAVYHFALPDEYNTGETYVLGEVAERYRKNGLTGFDYEQIKAAETLQRDTAAFVASAAGNFIRSISEQKEESHDLLMQERKISGLSEEDLGNAYTRVMRYFGGVSSWKDWNPAGNGEDFRILLLDQIRSSIYNLRNRSFHYSGGMPLDQQAVSGDSQGVVLSMLEHEILGASRVIRERYYSNNVWMFYEDKNIISLLSLLYGREADIPAQIPSFHSIFTKEKLLEAFKEWTYNGRDEDKKIWTNTLYFLLKECYYRGFLQDPGTRSAIIRKINNLDPKYDGTAGKKEKEAVENFKKTLFPILSGNQELSVGEICQYIMGEYNRQNNALQKVVSGKNTGNTADRRIYQHYPLLLYRVLRETFHDYIKHERNKNTYGFIGNPISITARNAAEIQEDTKRKDRAKEEFCKNWSAELFGGLKEEVSKEPLMFNWFLAAHFLSPVQLNHFKGANKSYIAFMSDIRMRAEVTGTYKLGEDERSRRCRDLLKVLELVSISSGQTTGVHSDYFPDTAGKTGEDIYASFIDKFVDYNNSGVPSYEALKRFCLLPNGQNEQGETIGIYYDAKNPIPNRNMIYADMYGNEGTIADCVSKLTPVINDDGTIDPAGKITLDELMRYYDLAKKLEPVFLRGSCESETELLMQRDFIKLKNRVELLDISIYTDIMNDLFNRLIVWCNLWERDQMYLKLGYQYVKLFFTDSIPENDNRRKLHVADGPIFEDGAVLYQIAAVYDFEMPLYECTDLQGNPMAAIVPSNKKSQWACERTFANKYSTEDVFYEGMEFFDNKNHHTIVKKRRNYIDHLNYYSSQTGGNNYSVMELYAFMYNDMFRYDTKLRKSVTYVFENVLMRYRVLSSLSMELGRLNNGTIVLTETMPDNNNEEGQTQAQSGRPLAVFSSSHDREGLRSDIFSFKINEKEGNQYIKRTYRVASRSRTFLIQLNALLVHKQQSKA